jgi:DMSO/TMAO reductase YedYZ heme-binding membrane subunit
MGKIPWYVARSSGIVAWALIVATIVWGLLLATKVLGRRPGPAWLLSLHRYLGALTVAFVGVHVGAVLLDTYTDFGITDVLVPFTGSWHPMAVAWGIVGVYLLTAIEITSLLRHRMSKRAWHTVHLLSYFLFATTTVHMLSAGTDVKALLASTAAVIVGTAAVFGAAALYVWRRNSRREGLTAAASREVWRGSVPVPSHDRRPVRLPRRSPRDSRPGVSGATPS